MFSSFHLLYETQSPDLIRQVFSTLEAPSANDPNRLEVPRYDIQQSPLDSFVVGYCIAHSNRLWLLDNEMLRGIVHTVQDHFQALSKGLNMSSNQCNGHIVVLRNVNSGISVLRLLHPHTQKLTELSIGIPNDSEESYSDFPSLYPLLKTLTVKTFRFSKSFVSLVKNLPSMRSLKMLCLDLSIDTDLMQLRKCHSLQHLEFKGVARFNEHWYIPPFAISPKLESLSISCSTLGPDPFLRKPNSLKTLVFRSCEILDVACDTLIDFLQSTDCVLESFELYDPDHLQYGIPDKLLVAIGSSRSLKRCVLNRFSGSIVQHLVTGMKIISSQSRLEDLTVICSSFCRKLEQGYFDELILVVYEHNTITHLRLGSNFEESVRKCDTRDNLNIETDCLCTYVR